MQKLKAKLVIFITDYKDANLTIKLLESKLNKNKNNFPILNSPIFVQSTSDIGVSVDIIDQEVYNDNFLNEIDIDQDNKKYNQKLSSQKSAKMNIYKKNAK